MILMICCISAVSVKIHIIQLNEMKSRPISEIKCINYEKVLMFG